MSKPSSPSGRRCIISAIALAGAFTAWNLWFVAGGWQRHQHRGEVALWLAASVIGILLAFDAIRLDRFARVVSGIAVALLGLHAASLWLLWMFLVLLADGGPKR